MLSTPPPSPAKLSSMRAIASLALASFASQAMVRAADTLLPQIAADLVVSVGVAAIIITVYALTHGSMQFLVGPIADRVGKYRTVAIACALCAVAVMLCGLANSLSSLTAARLLSGAAAAWILPIGLAFVGDVVPYEQRQQVLGRFLAGQVLGQMFGQAAGGIIGDHFGWRTVFFVLAALLALAAAALGVELAANPVTRPRLAAATRSLTADYRAVLGNPWARFILLVTGIEGALLQGIYPFVSADLHLRFGLSFTAIGIVVGVFAIGGLLYAALVKPLMRSLGQTGIANTGGTLMGLAFLTLAIEPVWLFAPLATLGVGLGFYMLHNTLQTEGTQMAPAARGTALALFASVYFLGQTAGVALAAPVMDRYGARPLFAVAAALLPALGFVFTRRLKNR
jgi:MFS transporter, YNFM family, putative membrane transport protein